ncbi:sulfate adenylyltransferase, small subunit [Chelatococcus sambhunathii]|uniref:Sulfate adenylyltransferase subunit 2 n=1 Tax=Chelatococcus sambhunathii TaxID=363953 RepID=A0ABP2A1F9_9HYPH|nr:MULTISPECIES: sulfate adenylyltransferase subunit CysD [Chelatococcus]CUA86845.1 sulfate adenylyltransferase, small subunit [Chelatococcus sambhunathii]
MLDATGAAPPASQSTDRFALSAHQRMLEAEAVHVLRETAAVFRRPALLYSIGKDSSVLLHLARKAFYPEAIPFKVVHVDTTWKFREMIAFRDAQACALGLDLVVHTNHEGLAAGISPFSHGAGLYTHAMKTVALRQILDRLGADAAIGGARRDEEKSRAKERMFSVRAPGHRWDPKMQRPEPWGLANTRLLEGETMRVFPLSNWTEHDVWAYVRAEAIPVVPLYFARERPVVRRGDSLIMVDDARLPLAPGETPQPMRVRFRTLGCYPLTAAVVSEAATLDAVIDELRSSRRSERAGRLIDGERADSIEAKKAEGYF